MSEFKVPEEFKREKDDYEPICHICGEHYLTCLYRGTYREHHEALLTVPYISVKEFSK